MAVYVMLHCCVTLRYVMLRYVTLRYVTRTVCFDISRVNDAGPVVTESSVTQRIGRIGLIQLVVFKVGLPGCVDV